MIKLFLQLSILFNFQFIIIKSRGIQINPVYQTPNFIIDERVDLDLHTGMNDVLYPPNSLTNPGALYPFGGELPSSRVHHSMALTDNYVIVYAGYSTDGSLLDDINMFDIRTQQWTGPILRKECCNEKGEIIETMGIDETQVVHDTTIYKTNETNATNTTNIYTYLRKGYEGDLPLARAEAGSCVVLNKLYIFGGITKPYGYSQQMYSFDPELLKWKDMQSSSSQIPKKRAGHLMLSIPNQNDNGKFNCKFLIFGGRTHEQNELAIGLNDLWIYDIIYNKWTRSPNNKGEKIPSGRQHIAGTIIGDFLYIYGGIDPASNTTYSDIWVYHLGLQSWQQIQPSDGNSIGFSPPPLYNAHMFAIQINDDTEDGLLLYGGLGGGGVCGSKDGLDCEQLETQIGQVYRLSVTTKNWDDDHNEIIREFSGNGYPEKQYITNSSWRYARMSAVGHNNQGLTKYYAYEKVIYDMERKLLYEFGGLEAYNHDIVRNGQSAVDSHTVGNGDIRPTQLDSGGGDLTQPYWDLTTGEQLRDTVHTPTNYAWIYQDAFEKKQPQNNFTDIKFHRAYRTYSINHIDITQILVNEIL